MSNTLVRVENLSKTYIVKKGPLSPKTLIRAVDNVSFTINQGEILGLIGESGCGKTTTGSLLLRLIDGDSGKVEFDNINLLSLNQREMRKMRKHLQVVFQLAQETLDPRMTIGELVAEPLKLHQVVEPHAVNKEVKRLLGLVGLGESEKDKFSYQLSGGQRQRVGIARSIASRPKFVVCDEPVSALDVSVQGQILNLLIDLKKELDLTYLFISHDLKVIKHICDRIAVMYKGRIVEVGEKNGVIQNPRDPYTKDLINSILL